jgi:hypothetical protein
MRLLLSFLPLLVALSTPNTADTFHASVEPILKERCMPCHFSGGKMYSKLPFDRPQKIVSLGERLFTRIKDEKQRAVIRNFLAGRKGHFVSGK